MINLRKISFLIILTVISANLIVAQAPPPVSSNKTLSVNDYQQSKFVSAGGGFTIDLPQQISAFKGIRSNAINKGGSQFQWQIGDSLYAVIFTDQFAAPQNVKKELQTLNQALINNSINVGGKLISTREINTNGLRGVETQLDIGKGAIVATRHYFNKDRLFILIAGWSEKIDGSAQLKVLDSFALIDARAIIAEKLRAATPQMLPQKPILKRVQSDAEEDGLKGLVKSVTAEKEDLTGTWETAGKKKSFEDYFNENGDRYQRITFDYKGNPMTVSVYGYVDDKRVANHNYLTYEYDPPPPAPAPAKKFEAKSEIKPADNRYSVRFEYKYDEKNRLKEKMSYRSDERLRSGTVYTYQGNTIEQQSYDEKARVYSKVTEKFDDKGLLIERTFDYLTPDSPPSVNTYTYKAFDEKGNWTERIVTGKEARPNGGYKIQNYIEYRLITYY